MPESSLPALPSVEPKGKTASFLDRLPVLRNDRWELVDIRETIREIVREEIGAEFTLEETSVGFPRKPLSGDERKAAEERLNKHPLVVALRTTAAKATKELREIAREEVENRVNPLVTCRDCNREVRMSEVSSKLLSIPPQYCCKKCAAPRPTMLDQPSAGGASEEEL